MQASVKESLTLEDSFFDLGKLTNYLWLQWKWFVAMGFGFALSFALFSYTLPNEYTSEILLADAESSVDGLDSLSGKLGGLASFAGLNVDSDKTKKLVTLQILKSRTFLVNFAKRHQLEVELFAVKSWDKESNSYIYDENVYDDKAKKWLMNSALNRSYYPSDLEIFEKVKTVFEVEVDKTNKVTKLELTYLQPEVAQLWLSMLIADLNNHVRQRDIKESEQQIKFLQAQLSLQVNAEIRNVFYSLIEEQLKSSTLANSREEYIFRVIDPASLPEKKSYPQRALHTVLGGLVGGALCFIFFTIRFVFNKS